MPESAYKYALRTRGVEQNASVQRQIHTIGWRRWYWPSFSVKWSPMDHPPVLVFSIYFSNSLIIHEEKTKEITTVKEVWICDPNYHKIREVLLWFSPRIINALRSYIKHSKECFIRYPNTKKLVKNTRLRLVFSTHFSVLGYPMKHSSLCLIYSLPNITTHKRLEEATGKYCLAQ